MGVGAYAAWLQRLLEAVQDRLPGRGPVSRGTTLGRGRTVETPDSRVPGLDHHRHGRARAGQLSDDRHGTGPRDRPHGGTDAGVPDPVGPRPAARPGEPDRLTVPARGAVHPEWTGDGAGREGGRHAGPGSTTSPP